LTIRNKKPWITTAFFIPNNKMKAVFLNMPLTFSLIPRIYPSLSDTLILTLRKEIDNTVLTPEFTFTVDEKVNITITEQPDSFKILDKYEIELKNESEVIYLGKLVILKEGTNTQNFEYGTQNERFTY
jgi:hypothetical protein